MRRLFLLIKRAIKWRSFGLALWVDAYENHTPRY